MQLENDASAGSTTEGLAIAPSLGPGLIAAGVERHQSGVTRRVVGLAGLAILLGAAAAGVAYGLTHLIGLITNLAFYQRASASFSSPAGNHLGLWVIAVPVLGALVVGVMARYGSAAIRGHGIPEAMEQVLTNQSRIPARLTFLKPLSAAIAIGTGGPFGAEGPIIATGGALGSLLGQLIRITADERKILLAAGAAAGMAATFGTPVAAVLLAIELLLFEYRPRSIIPVAMAAATATGVRIALVGGAPAFSMPDLVQPGGAALACYIAIGALVGIGSVLVTRAVYLVEDGFEKLPIHWMWWPALGALPVGLIGYFSPHTLGVGYDNIDRIASGALLGGALASLCALKFLSWSLSLGSGTSGGTLAPLLTIGGAMGALCATGGAHLVPGAHLDPRVAALVGMAAMFAGASRALLASVVFAFEATRQPLGLLPLLGGCSAAFVVSSLLMRNSIMTEKIERRGTRVPSEYGVDFLDQVRVDEIARTAPVTLAASQVLDEVRRWLDSDAAGSRHQGYPVVDGQRVLGVLTHRDLLATKVAGTAQLGELIRRPAVTVTGAQSLRQAADLMSHHKIGRLPVLAEATPHVLVGILTRSDLLAAHGRRLASAHEAHTAIKLRRRA